MHPIKQGITQGVTNRKSRPYAILSDFLFRLPGIADPGLPVLTGTNKLLYQYIHVQDSRAKEEIGENGAIKHP